MKTETATAYQRMPKPSQGIAPRYQFLRIYSPDLNAVKYASSVALIYEPGVATSRPNLNLQAATLTTDGIVIVGFAAQNQGKLASFQVPSFGDSVVARRRAVLGRLSASCDTVATPGSITGAPAIACAGGEYTLTVGNHTPGASYVWAYPKGWLGSDTGATANLHILTLKAGPDAQAGKISVAQKSKCAVSLPFGINIDKPLPNSISISPVPNVPAVNYNLPSGSAVWFVNGDTARRANGQPITSSTLLFSQVVPPIVNGNAITARLLNDCGSFVSNVILSAKKRFNQNPYPGLSQSWKWTFSPERRSQS